MALKKINIEELCLGMFVSELDISWVKSPFFRHKRLISKQEDIELLKKAGVESLVVDMSKSNISLHADDESSEGSSHTSSMADSAESDVSKQSQKSRNQGLPVPKVSLQQEFKAAKKIQSEVLSAVNAIQKTFENGSAVSVDRVNLVVEKTLESIDNNSQAIMALLHEGRDGGKIATHSFGVFALVLLLSSHLGYSVEDQQKLGLAALAHDAGWTKLPINLMSKGKAHSPSELKLVKQHIPIVVKMLRSQSLIPTDVVDVIEQHHEYLDGTGYPNGLSGDDILPWARLLATCNEYDEMVHGLGGHPGMTPQNALSSLFHLSKSGKLDHFFTANLISLLGVYPIGSAVELENGNLGVVVEIFYKSPLQPTVVVFYKERHVKLKNPKKISLSESGIKINRVLDLFGKDRGLDKDRLLVFNGEMLT